MGWDFFPALLLEGWGKNGVSFNGILIVVAVRYIKIALIVRIGKGGVNNA